MRAKEFENPKEKFVDMFRKFLPLAMEIIGLKSLPKMIFEKEVNSPTQPTFGQYVNNEHVLYVGLANRHPNDILRTIAHELVHYKQDLDLKLNDESGETGSPEENQAHALAGVVMRYFNKQYPEYLKLRPVINESIDEKLNRTGSNELVIFDIDDTLLHTTAKINVVKDGKVIKFLTNQEFNNYKLAPGEEFDFGEFRNAEKFEQESVPIGPMLNQLRNDLRSGKNVVMLTARADFDNQKAVWRTFAQHGIDINKDVHLYRAGNLPGSESPAVKKAIHINDWLKSGNYNKVVMYDDSEKNLTVFKSLQKRFPNVEFQAHHVTGDGDTKQVEASLLDSQHDQEAEKYRAQLIKTLPHMMKFLNQAVKGWSPSEEQMMAAIETAYTVMKNTGNIKQAGKAMMDELNTLHRMSQRQQDMSENFADGKNPGRKGLAKRSGVPTKASVSRLRQIAKSSSGEKARMAHWLANMKSGRKK